MKYFKIYKLLFIVCVLLCTSENHAQKKSAKAAKEKLNKKNNASNAYPFSDPNNEGNWMLNKEVSDEFEGTEIDTTKWFVEGQNGDYYIWKGRAPSQFAPHNVRVEDGILKLRTQWEPDYPFANESYADGSNNDTYGVFEGESLPITTAGIVGKKRFLNGYMEVKSKQGNAAITGAFWAIGYEQELDVYELMGNPKIDGNIKANSYLATAHDWSPPAVRPTKVFNHIEELPFRTADDFHVYGAEWGKDFLKLFIDGKLVHHFTQDQVGTDWVLNNPMEIWLDSEIFKWLGLPHKEELPVDFEIDYMRVWQKPTDNLLAPAFFGFEGPILFEENPRPLKMVPEDSTPNDYQKFWSIDDSSATYLSIVHGDYASGVNSLKFTGYGKNDSLNVDTVKIISPEGALKLPAGALEVSMKVWLDQGRVTDKIHVTLTNPNVKVVFSDLNKLARREWITVSAKINRTQASKKEDQMIIEIKKEDLPATKAAKFLIDDIKIKK
ncbi:glycoside hydrolase family 16 [Cellulophaga algicola DSM 14237]|uniref:Glycoside hydrolase family 16 n=1 Tax=Cellulophaga algicola (strain DSM 14237 / IC166 / ACAM 630) TaxID=688270 RepID=E6XA80_CELAD|nr:MULTISPECIES: family 16 glycosylhydrolase [Cellulophaga]ADV47770.1 glycoside hydrolase family 16 [Cellulophaga algicola DSM 14237]